MTNEVRYRLGGEVLQASALHDFPWPEGDPREVVQRVETWGPEHSDVLDRAVGNTRFNMERFLKETGQMGPAERVWRLLTHSAFNFNGVNLVRSEALWMERIERTVESGLPIEMPYPLICKIGNAAKRLTTVNRTAGERAIVRFFREIGALVKQVYEPGVRIHVLADATLYNSALFVPPPTAYAYMRDFEALIEEEGAGETVSLHDYSAALSLYWREFEERYNVHYAELAGAPVSAEGLGSLPTSVRTNVNSRRMGLSWEQMKRLFGPRQVIFTPLRADLDQQARFALVEQLAIKLACDDVDVPSRLWVDHVRATCHRGLKKGRAVLGLRCYPEYYGSSKLLPYHGMPLIEPDKRGVPRLVVLPEISLRGEADLVRVTNEHGEAVLYIQ